MKKIIPLALLFIFAASFCYPQQTQIPNAEEIQKARFEAKLSPTTRANLLERYRALVGWAFQLIGLGVDIKDSLPREEVMAIGDLIQKKNVREACARVDAAFKKLEAQAGSALVRKERPLNKESDSSPFGIHTSAVLPPQEYGVENPFYYAIDIGVKWERPPLYFIWTIIAPDPEKPEFNWNRYDRLISFLPDSMRIMGNITIGGPQKDRNYSDYARAQDSFAPKDAQAYKRFVRAVVERYDGDGIDDMPGLQTAIKYWQVENEPPHGMKDYAELLKITYEALKEADPDAKVIIGGVPGMPPHYIEEFDRSYLPILDELAKSKQRPFDIFDFHWYGDASGDYLGVKKAYEHIKQKVDERGLTPLDGYWITEMGTYSGDPKGIPGLLADYPFQGEREQAIDLLKRYVYPLSFGIKKIFLAFGLKEGFMDDGGYFDFTGLIYDGKFAHDEGKGVKKLSYYTYEKMTDILEGSDWNDIEKIQESGGVYIYKFKNKGNPVWVAWNDNKEAKDIEIKDIPSQSVVTGEFVPKYDSGKEVVNYNSAFNAQTKNVSGGIASVRLRNTPVFVIIGK